MQWIALGNLPAKVGQTCDAQLPHSFTIGHVKRLALVLCLLLGAAAGCARDDGEGELPPPCESDAAAFADALGAAPSPVRVDGVPLSDCLARNASAGDVQAVGATFLETAQQLGEKRDAVALGYLVGALRRGAMESQGIHLELVRRVEQEAQPFAGSAGFERGLRAGRTSG
jgi:hypothetical protein